MFNGVRRSWMLIAAAAGLAAALLPGRGLPSLGRLSLILSSLRPLWSLIGSIRARRLAPPPS